MDADSMGAGRLIIFVHGWRLSGKVDQVDFEPSFHDTKGWQRVYVTLPGMGGTRPDDSLTSMDSFIDAVGDFVEDQFNDRPFALVGTSAGAQIVRGLLLRFRRVQGVCLRVPLLTTDDRRRDLPELPASDEEGRLPTGYWRAVAEKEANVLIPARSSAQQTETLRSIRADPARYSAALPNLERFERPSLIIAGRQDTRVGFTDARRLAETYKRATYVMMDCAGHELPADGRMLFDAALRDWLERMGQDWR